VIALARGGNPRPAAPAAKVPAAKGR